LCQPFVADEHHVWPEVPSNHAKLVNPEAPVFSLKQTNQIVFFFWGGFWHLVKKKLPFFSI
jgi:hypothetical protein